MLISPPLIVILNAGTGASSAWWFVKLLNFRLCQSESDLKNNLLITESV